jgi:hypothetical protein
LVSWFEAALAVGQSNGPLAVAALDAAVIEESRSPLTEYFTHATSPGPRFTSGKG